MFTSNAFEKQERTKKVLFFYFSIFRTFFGPHFVPKKEFWLKAERERERKKKKARRDKHKKSISKILIIIINIIISVKIMQRLKNGTGNEQRIQN